jgi:hypothetical protein
VLNYKKKIKMQIEEIVSKSKVDDLMKHAFKIGEVQIFEHYSEAEKEIIEIKDYQHYLGFFQESIEKGRKYIAFGLCYKEAQDYWQINKINLDPEYCGGKTFRYNIEGWGIFIFN